MKKLTKKELLQSELYSEKKIANGINPDKGEIIDS